MVLDWYKRFAEILQEDEDGESLGRSVTTGKEGII